MKKFYSIFTVISVALALCLGSVGYSQGYDITLAPQCNTVTAGTETLSFTGTFPNANGAGTLTVYYGYGDLGSNTIEYLTVTGETGPAWPNATHSGSDCAQYYDSVTYTIPMADINAWAATGGQIDISVVASAQVNNFCTNGSLSGLSFCTYGKLQYPFSTGPNDAGANNITPTIICPGSDSVRVTINNYGTNQVDSVWVNWRKNSVLQTPMHLKTLLDTVGGVGSSSTVVNLGLHAFTAGNTENFEVWTTMPNGVVDTSTNNDTTRAAIKPSLTGTYTIGGTTPDYTTWNAAVADLVAIGICGPVVFDVRQGTYTEQIELPSINGSSAANTITFRNDPANTAQAQLSFAGTSNINNYVVKLNGIEHVTFDSLIFNATTSSFYGYVFHFAGVSNYVTIKNNTLNGRANQTSSLASIIYNNNTLSSNVTIDNNNFNDGGYIMYYRGGGTTSKGDSLQFTNNTCLDYTYYGVYLYYQDDVVFDNNTIKQSPSATSLGYGVFTGYCNNLKFRANHIELQGVSTNYGLYINRCSGTPTNKVEIYNNMIITSPKATGTAYGIYETYGKDINIFHNSVKVLANSNPTFTRAFFMTGFSSTLYGNHSVRNNIFYTDAAGEVLYVNSGASSAGYLATLDNNIYWAPNSANPFFFGTSAYPTFAAYQTASTRDSNSYYANPIFTAVNDLHLLGGSAADSGANLGVMIDIDGDARPLAPSTGYDIGADEYIPAPCPPGYGVANYYLSDTSGGVTWVAGASDTAWLVEYGTPGFTPGTGTSIHSSNDSLIIMGLTPVTFYDVYVRSICSNGDTSLYYGPINFRTNCTNQLSGNYTIDNSSPTAGTNFNSFADAAAELHSCGVSGPTVFLVDEGTYTEQMSLRKIVGASAINTITFKADPTNATEAKITYGTTSFTNNYVLQFDGAEHIIIDSLTIEPTNTVYGYAIYFPTTADNIVIKNNKINGIAGTTSFNCALIYNQSGNTNLVNNVTIDNNEMHNGSITLYWYGGNTSTKEKHFKFTNNTMKDFSSHGSYFYYQDSSLIEGNDWDQLSTSTAFSYGFYAYYTDNTKFSKNRIELNTTSTNYVLYFNRTNGTNNQVSNNMIISSPNAGFTAYGIYDNYTKNIKYYNNSVNVRGGNASGARCFYSSGSTSTFYGGNELVNNIFTNQVGGYASYIRGGAASTNYFSKQDHNLYYTSATTNAFYYNFTNYNTLPLYVTGSSRDSNSVFGTPGYFSMTNLHLQGTIANDAGDSTIVLADDFDGDTRPMAPSTRPDIGADEYIPPTCPSPGSMVFVGATTTSVDVSWTNGIADSIWEVQYGAPGFTIGTGTIVASPTDTATIPGLTPATCYDVWVRSICTVGDTSIWHGPINVCTECAAVTDYCEGFEGATGTSLPICWNTYLNTTSTGDIRVGTSTFNAFAGTKYIQMFNSFDASGTFIIVAPRVSNLAAGTHRANFWLRGDSTIYVGTMTDPNNPATFSHWDTLDPNSHSFGGYTNHKVDFNGYTGTDQYVAILWDPGRTYDNVYIDEYCWEKIPNCEKAPSVTVLNDGVDSTKINLGWNQDTTWFSQPLKYQEKFMVVYGPTGFTPGDATVIDTLTTATTSSPMPANNFMAVNGLTPLTEYCFWVKAICSNGDTSNWAGPICGSTGCPSGTPLPYSDDFSSYSFAVWPATLDNTPQCWEEATGTLTASGSVSGMTESVWEPDGFANVGGTGAARINFRTFGQQEGWLLSPTFNFGPDPNIARIVEFDVALTQQFSTNASFNGFGDDDTVALVVSYNGGVTWSNTDIILQWDTSNVPSHTGDHIVYIMRNTTGLVKFGFYGLSNIANEGVDFFVDNFSIRDTTWAGVDKNNSITEEFTVYPNPNEGIFTVLNTGKAKTSSVKMMDIQGRKVYDSQLNFSKNGTQQIQVENLTSGVYILLIQSEGKLEQHRVVVQ